MEKAEKKQKSTGGVSLLLLIPALLFGLISMALAIVGLGLIPLLPAAAGILLALIAMFFFRGSYRVFTRVVITISIVAALVSVFRGAILEKKVSADKNFDSTFVKTQVGIDNDLNDAFADDSLKSK
jgi:hypothetical protein